MRILGTWDLNVQFACTETETDMRTRDKFGEPNVQFASTTTGMRTRNKFKELNVQFQRVPRELDVQFQRVPRPKWELGTSSMTATKIYSLILLIVNLLSDPRVTGRNSTTSCTNKHPKLASQNPLYFKFSLDSLYTLTWHTYASWTYKTGAKGKYEETL
jgi:hypothetical protein